MRTAQELRIDPQAVAPSNPRWERMSFAERFWTHVDKSGNCWLWTAYRSPHRGYGIVGIGGKRTRQAHRVSWAMANGPIPPGMLVLHSRECVSRACVRPDHLRLGDQVENMADMKAMGTENRAKGERCARSKLTADIVLKAREMAAAGASSLLISETLGLSRGNVSNILRRVTWKHLPETRSTLPAAPRLNR